jgi:hypothetical protein
MSASVRYHRGGGGREEKKEEKQHRAEADPLPARAVVAVADGEPDRLPTARTRLDAGVEHRQAGAQVDVGHGPDRAVVEAAGTADAEDGAERLPLQQVGGERPPEGRLQHRRVERVDRRRLQVEHTPAVRDGQDGEVVEAHARRCVVHGNPFVCACICHKPIFEQTNSEDPPFRDRRG